LPENPGPGKNQAIWLIGFFLGQAQMRTLSQTLRARSQKMTYRLMAALLAVLLVACGAESAPESVLSEGANAITNGPLFLT